MATNTTMNRVKKQIAVDQLEDAIVSIFSNGYYSSFWTTLLCYCCGAQWYAYIYILWPGNGKLKKIFSLFNEIPRKETCITIVPILLDCMLAIFICVYIRANMLVSLEIIWFSFNWYSCWIISNGLTNAILWRDLLLHLRCKL